MAKFKIGIQLVETYNKHVIVEAKDAKEAIEKVDKVWHQDDGSLYDATSELLDNQEVRYFDYGKASKQDVKVFENLNYYEDETDQA